MADGSKRKIGSRGPRVVWCNSQDCHIQTLAQNFPEVVGIVQIYHSGQHWQIFPVLLSGLPSGIKLQMCTSFCSTVGGSYCHSPLSTPKESNNALSVLVLQIMNERH